MFSFVTARYLLDCGGYISTQSSPPASYARTREGKIRRTVSVHDDLNVDVDRDGFVLGVEVFKPDITVFDLVAVLRLCKLVAL